MGLALLLERSNRSAQSILSNSPVNAVTKMPKPAHPYFSRHQIMVAYASFCGY